MLPHIIWSKSCVVINTSTTRHVTGNRSVHHFEHHSTPVNTLIVYNLVYRKDGGSRSSVGVTGAVCQSDLDFC